MATHGYQLHHHLQFLAFHQSTEGLVGELHNLQKITETAMKVLVKIKLWSLEFLTSLIKWWFTADTFILAEEARD